jgi:hypothetical protein
MGDEDPWVQFRAILAYGILGNDSSIEFDRRLLNQLRTGSPHEKRTAARAFTIRSEQTLAVRNRQTFWQFGRTLHDAWREVNWML